MFKFCILLLSLSSIFLVDNCLGQESINGQITIVNVERNVILKTHLPKVNSIITLETTNSNGIDSFHYAVEGYFWKNAHHVAASLKKKDESISLKASQVKVSGHSGKLFYRIDLKQKLKPGKTAIVEVDVFLVNTLKPYPAQITQNEKQLVKFDGNVYQYSPYKVLKQTTVVKCTSSKINSYSKSPKPVQQKEAVITYGPYEVKEPFSEEPLEIHFENQSPFLTVTDMDRLIEVSHWGNIAVEETINIRHSGAFLKGSFSRFDYQHARDQGPSIKSFKTLLPASSKDVYYRDEIGNISTSNLKDLDDAVEIELRPRFPLFGGWKTNYLLGYNVPSYQYLFNSGSNFVLKMRFVDHIYDEQIVESLKVRVVLPEGATNIKVKTPFAVEREKDGKIYTYLDTFGRPVVTLSKKNLVDGHIQDFEISYDFNQLWMLQEPLLVVSFLFILFLTMIVYMRLDFSITKDEAKESRLRVGGLIEHLQATHDKRSALYQSYEDSINKFKSSKEASAFAFARKKIDSDYKQLTNEIDMVVQKLKVEQAQEADSILELQKWDKEARDQILLSISYAEKLVNGKMSKQIYLDSDETAKSKRLELLTKMENLVYSY